MSAASELDFHLNGSERAAGIMPEAREGGLRAKAAVGVRRTTHLQIGRVHKLVDPRDADRVCARRGGCSWWCCRGCGGTRA